MGRGKWGRFGSCLKKWNYVSQLGVPIRCCCTASEWFRNDGTVGSPHRTTRQTILLDPSNCDTCNDPTKKRDDAVDGSRVDANPRVVAFDL